MTEYIVLIPGNETEWAKADEAERARVYGKHQEFAEALAERGHKVTGGAELATVHRGEDRRGVPATPSTSPTARTPRPSSSSPATTRSRATTSTTCSSASASSPRARARSRSAAAWRCSGAA